MKLAANQPLFLPPLDFFFKMSQVDFFLLADQLQYSTNANLNRGKIKTVNGPAWLTVPVLSKGKSRQPIYAAKIDQHTNWQKQHLKTLLVNYRNAPYFELYREQLEEIYFRPWGTLCDFSTELITFFQSQLFMKTKIRRMSVMNLTGSTNAQLVAALQQLNCQQYLVETHCQPFVDEPLFAAAGFNLNLIQYDQPEYHQQFGRFEPGLSILDLLFNEGEMSFRFFEA